MLLEMDYADEADSVYEDEKSLNQMQAVAAEILVSNYLFMNDIVQPCIAHRRYKTRCGWRATPMQQ